MIIQGCIIDGISTLKDGSIKVILHTNDLDPAPAAELLGLRNKFAYVAIKEEKFKKEDTDLVESLKSDFVDTKKSKSQRLRDVLFRTWQQKNEGHEKFDGFYDSKMEVLISHFISKLD